ncbi:hypothetical protein D3C81_1459320 [compost metagenome]
MCRSKPDVIIIVPACCSNIARLYTGLLLDDLIRQMNLFINLIIAKLTHIKAV